MPPGRPSSFIKPTVDTKFHIDYEWWARNEGDYRAYLLTHLPPEKREQFAENTENQEVDYVDPETGEVFRLDALRLAIREAAKAPDFINLQVSLVDSVFRVFLANDNQPLTPRELAEKTGRSASVILKTFGGLRVYRGIRPYQPERVTAD